MLVARLGILIFGEIFYFTGLLISKDLASYHLDTAISIDKLLNVLVGPLANLVLIKKGGRRFGSHKETMSAVFGYNKKTAHLRKLGMWIAAGLNFIEEDHVEKAVIANDKENVPKYKKRVYKKRKPKAVNKS